MTDLPEPDDVDQAAPAPTLSDDFFDADHPFGGGPGGSPPPIPPAPPADDTAATPSNEEGQDQ